MRMVLVVAMKSFDQYEKGQEYWVLMTERTANLIVNMYFQVIWDPAWSPE